jgi:TM2 domain-containing membrane protein YozV
MKTTEEKYCFECGAAINSKAEICPKCGVRQPIMPGMQNPATPGTTNKMSEKWIITFILAWFLGYLGVHRFYTGHTLIGVLQLITLGGCGIWVIIDIILLIAGNYKDSDGNPITYN